MGDPMVRAILRAMAPLLVVAMVSLGAAAQEQIVSGTLSLSELRAGESSELTVTYRATDDGLASGLGLRLHYDSSALEMGAYRDLLDEKAQAFQIQEDLSDFDNNVNTDKYFIAVWADTSGDGWPYVAAQPITLYVVPFIAKTGFEGSTLSFTAFSAPGYSFSAENVPIGQVVLPVISLSGDAEVRIKLGSTYTDAGATATDSIDGDITSSIVTLNSVDVNTVGTYKVTYNVSNALGDAAREVFRLVKVGGTLDIDGNGKYDALTDGLLLLRGMFGLDDDALISGAVASDAVYISSIDIDSRIDDLGNLIDIDGNGRVDALTDGLIILRYLFGLRGDVLINGVIASDATITSISAIHSVLEGLMPEPLTTLLSKSLRSSVQGCSSIIEGNTSLCRLAGLDLNESGLTLELLGEDSDDFVLETDGQIRFVAAPSFATPSDINVDNVYNLVVRLSNGEESTTENLSVDVVSECDVYVNSAVTDEFRYCWQESQVTPSGHEYSAAINTPLKVAFSNDTIAVPPSSAAEELFFDYGIVLSDEDKTWGIAEAYAMKEVLKKIPQDFPEKTNDLRRADSKWILTDRFIVDDIDIQIEADGTYLLTLSNSVFSNATPRIAEVEGKRGVYFSNRLHHSLVRYITNNGNNTSAVNKILTDRFAVSVEIPDYNELTGEPATRFQSFHPEELISIINMFEEMPSGMHKIAGLNYLVRRLDGLVNPYYPEAPAIAWVGSGYIEFMEVGLGSDSLDYTHRLIIHEKAHFLWGKVFDDNLKEDWINLGGWYECAEKTSGWCSTQQTQFVSAYAHLKNPDEDMAESISFFLVNPDKLRSRAPDKYTFVRDRIMQGNIYLSQIRDDLTFEVFNLFPDYVYPGKIKLIKVSVLGGAYEDKHVSISLELHSNDVAVDGATQGQTRITSEAVPETFIDFWMYTPESMETSDSLSGSFVIPARAKSGYWSPEQIVVWDNQGNSRMSGANDFGWRLYVDNPLEDITAPIYIQNSMELSISSRVIEDETVPTIVAIWDYDEANIKPSQFCYGAINDELISTYSLEAYGDVIDGKCYLEYLMPDYMPSEIYRINFMRMIDVAGNESRNYFSSPQGIDQGLWSDDSADEPSPSVTLTSSNPDIIAPELDVNSISVTAIASNPEQPNGETILTVNFKIRDNISGYTRGGFRIRDPQGITHHYWHYSPDRDNLFPSSSDTVWRVFTATVVLPAGSAPGIWGLAEFAVRDRANNFKVYDFTEIITFEVDAAASD